MRSVTARERGILASLQPSHIARLYDAGIGSDGQPYLALEYVEGHPLDEYAGQKRLDVRVPEYADAMIGLGRLALENTGIETPANR